MAVPNPVEMPTSATSITDDTGKVSPQWARYFASLTKAAKGAVAGVNGVEPWAWTGLIQSPEDGDLRVVVAMPFAVTITSVTTISSAGTATLTVKINTTALGGTANSVSTSEQTQAHTTANAMIAGDDLVITLASVSGTAANVSVTISGTVA